MLPLILVLDVKAVCLACESSLFSMHIIGIILFTFKWCKQLQWVDENKPLQKAFKPI